MQTMIRRYGGFSREREFAWIYRPQYRQYIRKDAIKSAYEFKQIQQDMEEFDKLNRNV